jgi:hypothetical protein
VIDRRLQTFNGLDARPGELDARPAVMDASIAERRL